MKKLRITTAKTRKGILNWLSAFNPHFTTLLQETVFESPAYVAVHINRNTATIEYWELADGTLQRFLTTAYRTPQVSVVWPTSTAATA